MFEENKNSNHSSVIKTFSTVCWQLLVISVASTRDLIISIVFYLRHQVIITKTTTSLTHKFTILSHCHN